MLNTLKAIDCLLDTDNYLLFNLSGPGPGVGHIDADKVGRYGREHLLAHILRAKQAAH